MADKFGINKFAMRVFTCNCHTLFLSIVTSAEQNNVDCFGSADNIINSAPSKVFLVFCMCWSFDSSDKLTNAHQPTF